MTTQATTATPDPDPGNGANIPDISIDWQFFPWMDPLLDAVGGVRALGLAVCIMSLVLCGMVWGVGHALDLGHYGTQAKIGVMVACIVAAVIGAAVSIISFFADIGTTL